MQDSPLSVSGRRVAVPGPTRRRLLQAAATTAAVSLVPGSAMAILELDVTSGTFKPLTIAVPPLVGLGGGAQFGADMATIISNDLQRSGLFAPLQPGAFAERPTDPNVQPNFSSWRVVNAQAVVVGAVEQIQDGRLRAEFRLWDIASGQQIAGQQFFTTPDNWRRLAHIIADAIYQRMTGEQGLFDSRVVFVEETGPKDNRRKRLAIMDQDGANVRYLTEGNELVLTPRFSPSSQAITYMSYEGGTPQVYLLNVDTGARQLLGNFPGMSFAPRFSPDGRSVVLSLQDGGNANIFSLDLSTRQTRQLTNVAAISTSPSYSPDGQRIVFESDRGGSQQLYVMGADGSNPTRISFGEGSYSTPVWSPRGDLIAFTRRHAGEFAIGVLRPDGSGERILTEGYHNEGPTWSPNGRVLMFFRDRPGADGGPQLWTIDTAVLREYPVSLNAFASDPAWSPLING